MTESSPETETETAKQCSTDDAGGPCPFDDPKAVFRRVLLVVAVALLAYAGWRLRARRD